eukprot:TRINITY_DN13836_c0_g1_i3.p1 TRINITY_DN13836_c0_g1~~TRINITY_DN13836_c0_g1_i3.p1  ORF type:complete len:300 (-),score=57.54 TRINITY_DN13836_c0_g1_i3:12-911(-)
MSHFIGMSKLDKNNVYFRFAHENNGVEKITFYGKEIAVGDLRQAIAEKKHVPKIDLVLVNESTKEVYERDGAMVSRNVSILVRRTPVQTKNKSLPAVVHVGGHDAWANMPAEPLPKKKEELPPPPPDKKSPCPPEYLCPVCRCLFKGPSIAPCCGRSACASCFKEGGESSCPLCSRELAEHQQPIPNKRLADIVASLDLDYFEIPGASQQAAPVALAAPVAPAPAAPWPHAALPPPSAMTVRPCMLSPEQFHAWQQSIRADVKGDRNRSRRKHRHRSGSRDSSDERRRERKRMKKLAKS